MRNLSLEETVVGFATDPSLLCIDPGTADLVVVQVGMFFHSLNGNPGNKPKTVICGAQNCICSSVKSCLSLVLVCSMNKKKKRQSPWKSLALVSYLWSFTFTGFDLNTELWHSSLLNPSICVFDWCLLLCSDEPQTWVASLRWFSILFLKRFTYGESHFLVNCWVDFNERQDWVCDLPFQYYGSIQNSYAHNQELF